MMIRLTKHAEDQMADRGIAMAWVEATVLRPDWTQVDPSNPTCTRAFRIVPEFGGRVLRVVHRPDAGDSLVVTVFFDRRAKR